MHFVKLAIFETVGILTLFFHGLTISGIHALIPTIITAITGKEVTLTCYTGTFTGSVTWLVHSGRQSLEITTCEENEQMCGEIEPLANYLAIYNGTRNVTTSTLKLVSQNDVGIHECKKGEETLQLFELVFVNQEDIQRPTCHVAPTAVSDEFHLEEINFTCNSSNERINQLLQINFEEESISKTPTESTHLTYTTDYAFFADSSQGSCKMSIEGVSKTWSCVFPTHVDVISTTKGTDMEFECCAGGVVEEQISWSMLEHDGFIDIMNRSWIRGEGRSMLLLEITTDDYGRVVQCLVHQPGDQGNITSIGFYMIIPGEGFTPFTMSTNEKIAAETTTYKVLFACSFILWLLTVAVILAWVIYPRAKEHWQL